VPPAVAAVPGLDDALRLQDRTAQLLRRRRHELGALELAIDEPRAVFQGDVVTDLRPDERSRAKGLIEDLMICVNGVSARYLESKGFPSQRRVLRSPERWSRLMELAASLGETLPATPSSGALEALLLRRRQADPDRLEDLSLSVVKLLGRGRYALELPGQRTAGHFGPAVRDYTHSTAPNRRYPDLVTQRLLKAALAGAAVPYGADELSAIAQHCTTQEDNAAKVERRVRKAAAALLLSHCIGDEFDAIVGPTTEGRVTGGAQGLDVGDRVRVRLVHTDVEQGHIDLHRAD
jgi:exoribonuclease-2